MSCGMMEERLTYVGISSQKGGKRNGSSIAHGHSMAQCHQYVPLKQLLRLNVAAVGIEDSLINRLNNITQQLCIGQSSSILVASSVFSLCSVPSTPCHTQLHFRREYGFNSKYYVKTQQISWHHRVSRNQSWCWYPQQCSRRLGIRERVSKLPKWED